MRLARNNADKPHRCPACHRISDKAREHGRARWLHVYKCEDCQLMWTVEVPHFYYRALNAWGNYQYHRLVRKAAKHESKPIAD